MAISPAPVCALVPISSCNCGSTLGQHSDLLHKHSRLVLAQPGVIDAFSLASSVWVAKRHMPYCMRMLAASDYLPIHSPLQATRAKYSWLCLTPEADAFVDRRLCCEEEWRHTHLRVCLAPCYVAYMPKCILVMRTVVPPSPCTSPGSSKSHTQPNWSCPGMVVHGPPVWVDTH